MSPIDAILYSNCREDLSCLLFTLLYHQVSSLDYYHNMDDMAKTTSVRFDLSAHLKQSIQAPFSMNDLEQAEVKSLKEQQLRAYELNYKLETLLRQKLEAFRQERAYVADAGRKQLSSLPIEARLKEILDNKFRVYWNFKWHGGSLLKLCNDLLNNEAFVQNESNCM